MAASAGNIGQGATLSYSADGVTYTTLAEVVDVMIPEVTVADVKFTHYTSDNTVQEYKPGWKDGSNVDVELNYTSTAEAALRALVGVSKFWRVTVNDFATTDSKWVFQGYINKQGGAMPNEDRATIKVSIKPTTAITFTAGS